MENHHPSNELSLNYQKIKLDEFKSLLKDYLGSDKASRFGLPDTNYFADKLMIETDELENLIKKETGVSVREYIDVAIINTAKLKLFDTAKSINHTASELGFKNLHHFTRLFKDKTGTTPSKYREVVNKYFKVK